MDRRRFLAALIATPIAAALAPLVAKNPRQVWVRPELLFAKELEETPFGRYIGVKEDLTETILYATSQAEPFKVSLDRGMVMDPASLVPGNWYWLEIRPKP